MMNLNYIYIFFLLCLLLVFNINTTAQDVKSSSPDVKFGVVAGPNFSTFQSDLFNGNFRVGFHVGLMTEIELKNKWKLRPEIIYSQQGMIYKDGDIHSQTKVKYFNNYIDIPFLLEYKFSYRFAGYIGPGIGFLLKATEITVYAGNEDSENVTDTYNRVDVGFYMGAEYYIFPKFSLGLRFYSGFMYVEIGADRKKNFHFQIPLTYTF